VTGQSELPAPVRALLERLPGADSPEEAGLVYDLVKPCEGIVVLAAPTVRTAAAAIVAAGSNTGIGEPRVYLIDSRRDRLAAIFRVLATEELAGGVTLYHGTAGQFLREVPLEPSLLIDGAALGRGLPAPPPVHLGGFVPDVRSRVILQGRLNERCFLAEDGETREHTPVSDLTVDIRREYARRNSAASGYGAWPHAVLESTELPRTLPSGKPWPKISIVTPSFNQGAYIEETLLSVLGQGYPNVEHIVVDGGSSDGTRAILERYRERLACVIHEPDNGQSHAINKGMARATGEILTWLNSDDMLAPGALASVAMAFDTQEADMIAGICRLYRNGKLEAQHITSCADGPLPLDDLLDLDHGWNAGQFFYQPEVMFTREIWLRAGGYVNDWLHYSMDYELWLRFAEAGARLHVIGRPVAWFRLHEQQKTHVASRFQAELLVCRRAFLKKNGRELVQPAHPGEIRQRLRVTLLNDIGPFYGAGIAHVRLARALAWAGHEVALVSILDRSLVGFESTHYTSQSVLDQVVESRPDLVIVGNLHAAGADPLLLKLLCERFPAAVVMHDFWAMTGRCAYPGGCEKYLTGCDHTCPTPDEYPALAPEKISGAWWKKRLAFGEPGGPAILASTAWAAEIARKTFAAAAHDHQRTPGIAEFHLSFPLEVFRPRDKRTCRETFGLPADRFLVLLAGSVLDPRKGGPAFLEALGALDLPNLLVIALGQPDPALRSPVEIRQLGQIDSQYKVAMIHAAADVVVAPSTEEMFGQSFVESIACGTPAVGYPGAAMRGAIRDGVTGIVAGGNDPASLAAAVQSLYMRPEERRDLARWGRMFVENEWSEFAASRHLILALRSIGFDGRLQLRRNIRFSADEPAIPRFHVISQCHAGWRPVQGFSQTEAAVPLHGLKPYRWAFGPSAIADVFAQEPGLHRVLLAYRNTLDGQRIQFRCNGAECGTFGLAATGFGAGRILVANVELGEGSNLLQMEFSRWEREGDRPLALIVTDILVEPVAPGDHLARQTSAAEMLSAVWGVTGDQR
jgi:glycosyltransferase involved in cell wall biosynthesis